MASALARSSASRTACRSARTSGVSAAGLRISPSSPPVQHTSAARMPSAAYRATVPAPFDASSSGCACTDTRHNGLPATDRARRRGSLVFNFGGPGDPGSETLPTFASAIPSAVRARYDLVSFDPRGTGKSRPVECVDDAQADRLNAEDPTPNSDVD